MIKYSFYTRELKELIEQYGGKVLSPRDASAVIVRDFLLPAGFKTSSCSVYLEIPSGFGYGVNIQNSYLLLGPEDSRKHLIESDIWDDIERSFDMRRKSPQYKNKKWYWMCLHLGKQEDYRFAPFMGHKVCHRVEIGNPEYFEAEESREDPAPPAPNMIGLTEYLKLLQLVLQKIAAGDSELMKELSRMNEGRSQYRADCVDDIRSAEMSNNWRKMKWMF